MDKITLNGICKRLPVLTLFLIGINLLAVSSQHLLLIRVARWLSIAIFSVYYYHISIQKSVVVLLILSTLLIRDTSLFFFETVLGHRFYLIFGIIVYAAICVRRYDILKLIFLDKTLLLLTVVLIGLNTFALYKIAHSIQLGFRGPFEPSLFYVYGGLMILLGATAMVYNQIFNSNRSLIYVFFILCFLASDITSLFAYYFDFTFLYYVDKFSFILGLGLFSYTVLDTSNHIEETEQYAILSIQE